MTDLEIQEQAKKILQEYKGDSCYIHEDDAIGAMNDLVKWMQEQDKWVSVNDVHPEYDVHVIVYCRIYGRYLASWRRIDPDYNWGEWRDFNNNVCLHPTHWQPLPSPPKTK